jgi:plastocyanin
VPRRSARVAAVAFVLLSVLAMAPPVQAAVVVHAYETSWSPTSVSIGRGGQVQWSATRGDHNVHAYGGNWRYVRTLPRGASTAARTFHNRGTYRFYCTIHGHLHNGHCSGMCGRVVVG